MRKANISAWVAACSGTGGGGCGKSRLHWLPWTSAWWEWAHMAEGRKCRREGAVPCPVGWFSFYILCCRGGCGIGLAILGCTVWLEQSQTVLC